MYVCVFTLMAVSVDDDGFVIAKCTQRHHVVMRMIVHTCHRCLVLKVREHGHLVTYKSQIQSFISQSHKCQVLF